MTSQEPSFITPAYTDDEAEHLVRKVDAQLAKVNTTIDRLQSDLSENTTRRDALTTLREEAASLCGVGPRLRAMRQKAMEHGILPDQLPDSTVTLHVVPDPTDTADAPTSPPRPTTTPPEPSSSGAGLAENAPPSGPVESEEQPATVLIRSEKQQQVLTVLAARPATEPLWGSEEIAAALDIPKDAKQRKSLRNCLQALVLIGALERVTHEDDRHVRYRPRMNWKFA